jgi:hypothetical protein
MLCLSKNQGQEKGLEMLTVIRLSVLGPFWQDSSSNMKHLQGTVVVHIYFIQICFESFFLFQKLLGISLHIVDREMKNFVEEFCFFK